MREGSGPDPTDFAGWMRNVQRRLSAIESRPAAIAALDLLGPGIDSSASLTPDWNDDTIYFNGTYYSEPAAKNAPDSTHRWVGIVMIDDIGSGYQLLISIPTATATTSDLGSWTQLRKQRVFNTPNGSTRVYSAWSTA